MRTFRAIAEILLGVVFCIVALANALAIVRMHATTAYGNGQIAGSVMGMLLTVAAAFFVIRDAVRVWSRRTA